MVYNDILKKLRYNFDYSDTQMIQLFALVEMKVTGEQLNNWLKKDDEPGYVLLPDFELASFLNGLIIEKRGKKDGPLPVAEQRLNNNVIFRKLKIALSLTDDDVLEMMSLADFRMSKHEISAFFRAPEQRQYRPCNDQVLRNFLHGMQKKLRPKA